MKNPNSGLKNIPDGTNLPIHFFKLIFSELIEDLHQSTNRYVEKMGQMYQNQSSVPWILSKKENITVSDIEKYLAIFFVFGLYRVPNITDHWNPTDHFLKSLHPVFPYHTWKYIHRVIHTRGFCGDTQHQSQETSNPTSVSTPCSITTLLKHSTNTQQKINDLSWLINHANTIIKQYYNPMLVFSLDDDLYKWTGRVGGKKYLPAKADSIGNILWKLADENKYIYILK